jgi:hypothetical protein
MAVDAHSHQPQPVELLGWVRPTASAATPSPATAAPANDAPSAAQLGHQ